MMLERLATCLYVLLLRLYPRPFFEEFGDEMQEVFIQAQAEHQASIKSPGGRLFAMVAFYLRELRDFPLTYLQVRSTQAIPGGQSDPGGPELKGYEEMLQPRVGRRAPWGEALIGALPYIFFGLAYLIIGISELAGHGYPSLKLFDGSFLPGSADQSTISFTGPMGVYFISVLGLLFGVLKGFPRWSYAYLGMSLYLGWDYSSGRFGGVHYGAWAWLPLVMAVLLGLVFTRSLQPFSRLLQGVWSDWTRLSFALYAFPLMLTVVFFDDDWGISQLYGLAFDTVVIAAGAVAYLRSPTAVGRVLTLQVPVLIVVVKGFLGGWFWPGFLVIIILFNGLLLLPAVVGLLKRSMVVFAAR